MRLRFLSRLKRVARHPGAAAALVLVGQTNTTSTAASVDLSPMVNIISAVIPLFVLVAVIKILFRSFKDVA